LLIFRSQTPCPPVSPPPDCSTTRLLPHLYLTFFFLFSQGPELWGPQTQERTILHPPSLVGTPLSPFLSVAGFFFPNIVKGFLLCTKNSLNAVLMDGFRESLSPRLFRLSLLLRCQNPLPWPLFALSPVSCMPGFFYFLDWPGLFFPCLPIFKNTVILVSRTRSLPLLFRSGSHGRSLSPHPSLFTFPNETGRWIGLVCIPDWLSPSSPRTMVLPLSFPVSKVVSRQ